HSPTERSATPLDRHSFPTRRSSDLTPTSGIPRQFFRLRSPTIVFTTNYSGGQFTLSGPGVPGCNFIFQASTNLTDWVNLQTNPRSKSTRLNSSHVSISYAVFCLKKK